MPTPLRAALLASWGTAYLLGAEPLESAVAAVEGDDEPHLVVSDPLGGPDELAEALVAMRAEGLAGLRLALPVPGDLVGLAGPPSFNQAVLAVGEAAIGIADPARAGNGQHPAPEDPVLEAPVEALRWFPLPGEIARELARG